MDICIDRPFWHILGVASVIFFGARDIADEIAKPQGDPEFDEEVSVSGTLALVESDGDGFIRVAEEVDMAFYCLPPDARRRGVEVERGGNGPGPGARIGGSVWLGKNLSSRANHP